MEIVNIKFEKCDVYCGRPSIYSNPFKIGESGTRDDVCDKYDEYFNKRIVRDIKFREAVLRLKGKKCGCYCKLPNKEVRCHLDTIKKWLDSQP